MAEQAFAEFRRPSRRVGAVEAGEIIVEAGQRLVGADARARRAAVPLAGEVAGNVGDRFAAAPAAAAAGRRGDGLAVAEVLSAAGDVTRDDVVATGKGMELVIGAEIQRCYGNAFLEVLTAPRDDKERNFMIGAVTAACERLLANEIVCAFSLTPADDVKMATAFVAAGFRRTGLLRQHLRVKNDRVDAILWSRKLATPGEEE